MNIRNAPRISANPCKYNNPRVKEEIKRRIRMYFKLNENKASHPLQNLWGGAKAAIRWIFVSLNAHIKEEESFQINGLSFYLSNTKAKKKKKEKETHRRKRKSQKLVL
jgi:hypothetical protein